MKFSQVRHWASKIDVKLKYRGKYEEFAVWKKQVLSAAHGLSINMELQKPTMVKLLAIDPSQSSESKEFKKKFNDLLDFFAKIRRVCMCSSTVASISQVRWR